LNGSGLLFVCTAFNEDNDTAGGTNARMAASEQPERLQQRLVNSIGHREMVGALISANRTSGHWADLSVNFAPIVSGLGETLLYLPGKRSHVPRSVVLGIIHRPGVAVGIAIGIAIAIIIRIPKPATPPATVSAVIPMEVTASEMSSTAPSMAPAAATAAMAQCVKIETKDRNYRQKYRC